MMATPSAGPETGVARPAMQSRKWRDEGVVVDDLGGLERVAVALAVAGEIAVEHSALGRVDLDGALGAVEAADGAVLVLGLIEEPSLRPVPWSSRLRSAGRRRRHLRHRWGTPGMVWSARRAWATPKALWGLGWPRRYQPRSSMAEPRSSRAPPPEVARWVYQPVPRGDGAGAGPDAAGVVDLAGVALGGGELGGLFVWAESALEGVEEDLAVLGGRLGHAIGLAGARGGGAFRRARALPARSAAWVTSGHAGDSAGRR